MPNEPVFLRQPSKTLNNCSCLWSASTKSSRKSSRSRDKPWSLAWLLCRIRFTGAMVRTSALAPKTDAIDNSRPFGIKKARGLSAGSRQTDRSRTTRWGSTRSVCHGPLGASRPPSLVRQAWASVPRATLGGVGPPDRGQFRGEEPCFLLKEAAEGKKPGDPKDS